MPTGTFGDLTADAKKATFSKRKATALYNRVERLVDSLSSAALTSCDESGLHVMLELIDEVQESFKKVLGELEELDFEEIESGLSEKFDDILVILKSSVRSEISKRASELYFRVADCRPAINKTKSFTYFIRLEGPTCTPGGSGVPWWR